MRIIITRDRESSGGGIFNYYQNVVPHLNSQICFVSVGRPYSFYGKRGTAPFRFTWIRLICDWLALFFKIVLFRPDLVHINPSFDPPFSRSLRRGAINVLTAHLLGKRVLVFWRGWENSYCGNPEFPGGNKSLFCRIYKMADAHIVLCERFKEDLRNWGFDTPIHVETTVASDECLAGSEKSPHPGKVRTNLMYLSRIEAAKGVFELVDAYKILKARNPNYTLTIAGDGPDLRALRDYVRNWDGLDVSFPGFVKGKEKVECYQRGSVFCFLSTFGEGMPNAVLEALAMGLPVVSSNIGGLRDILCDGENGFIIPDASGAPLKKRFDPITVANAIELLAKSPELYERIATANWRYARQRFAAPVVAKRLEEIYRSVLADEPSRSKSAEPACAE